MTDHQPPGPQLTAARLARAAAAAAFVVVMTVLLVFSIGTMARVFGSLAQLSDQSLHPATMHTLLAADWAR